ncbi:hypothetical protein FB451DRAFT_1518341 [Mycena latifolia]|nr:hypothetical protein FB451DRAFT_1518341 [Mycena latifolia]
MHPTAVLKRAKRLATHTRRSWRAKPTFKKLLQGGNDTLKPFREFEIVDLESLETQGLLDAADESLDFVRNRGKSAPDGDLSRRRCLNLAPRRPPPLALRAFVPAAARCVVIALLHAAVSTPRRSLHGPHPRRLYLAPSPPRAVSIPSRRRPRGIARALRLIFSGVCGLCMQVGLANPPHMHAVHYLSPPQLPPLCPAVILDRPNATESGRICHSLPGQGHARQVGSPWVDSAAILEALAALLDARNSAKVDRKG